MVITDGRGEGWRPKNVGMLIHLDVPKSYSSLVQREGRVAIGNEYHVSIRYLNGDVMGQCNGLR
jgi:superfamily II DNA/RNA helicase